MTLVVFNFPALDGWYPGPRSRFVVLPEVVCHLGCLPLAFSHNACFCDDFRLTTEVHHSRPLRLPALEPRYILRRCVRILAPFECSDKAPTIRSSLHDRFRQAWNGQVPAHLSTLAYLLRGVGTRHEHEAGRIAILRYLTSANCGIELHFIPPYHRYFVVIYKPPPPL